MVKSNTHEGRKYRSTMKKDREKDRRSSYLINETLGSVLSVCQDLNELNMKMLFTM
jgi:hypothetical protein